MGRKGAIHHEPNFVSVLEGFPESNACKEIFEGVWYHFFQRFQGHDNDITLKLSQGFNGKVIHIGILSWQFQRKQLLVPLVCLVKENAGLRINP